MYTYTASWDGRGSGVTGSLGRDGRDEESREDGEDGGQLHGDEVGRCMNSLARREVYIKN